MYQFLVRSQGSLRRGDLTSVFPWARWVTEALCCCFDGFCPIKRPREGEHHHQPPYYPYPVSNFIQLLVAVVREFESGLSGQEDVATADNAVPPPSCCLHLLFVFLLLDLLPIKPRHVNRTAVLRCSEACGKRDVWISLAYQTNWKSFQLNCPPVHFASSLAYSEIPEIEPGGCFQGRSFTCIFDQISCVSYCFLCWIASLCTGS